MTVIEFIVRLTYLLFHSYRKQYLEKNFSKSQDALAVLLQPLEQTFKPSRWTCSVKLALMSEGHNLLLLIGNHASEYAVNDARALFDDEDLMHKLLSPQKDIGIRPRIYPENVSIVIQCIGERFPDEWHAGQEAVNQHCRDLKNGKVKKRPVPDKENH